eukprot:210026-Chlamydomonas_euryale.AAC.2
MPAACVFVSSHALQLHRYAPNARARPKHVRGQCTYAHPKAHVRAPSAWAPIACARPERRVAQRPACCAEHAGGQACIPPARQHPHTVRPTLLAPPLLLVQELAQRLLQWQWH